MLLLFHLHSMMITIFDIHYSQSIIHISLDVVVPQQEISVSSLRVPFLSAPLPPHIHCLPPITLIIISLSKYCYSEAYMYSVRGSSVYNMLLTRCGWVSEWTIWKHSHSVSHSLTHLFQRFIGPPFLFNPEPARASWVRKPFIVTTLVQVALYTVA